METALQQILALSPLLLVIVIAALVFDFVNGWNDSANAIATIVSTRVLTPLRAVLLAAVFNMVGALAGTAVAQTIVKGLIRTDIGYLPPDAVMLVVLAAMVGAILWAAWMTVIGMPISGSHSLIGGLAGAAVAAGGARVLIGPGIGKVLIAMLLSPLFGVLFGFLLTVALIWLVHRMRPNVVERVFTPLQLVSCSVMAFNHGLNDAQKVMGVITMALVAGGVQAADAAGKIYPLPWVQVSCGLAIALGTAIGGWKVIKTLGLGLSKLNTMGGFAAESAASLVLYVAATLGIPVSTTHTITGAIVGVGSTRGVRGVQWGLGEKIVLAWVFTLPATAMLGGFVYWVLGIQCGLVK